MHQSMEFSSGNIYRTVDSGAGRRQYRYRQAFGTDLADWQASGRAAPPVRPPRGGGATDRLAGNAMLIAASKNRWSEAWTLVDMSVTAGLPPGLVAIAPVNCPEALAPWLATRGLGAIHLSPQCSWRREICRVSAARAGHIIPVLCEPASVSLLARFVHEKTVTENTTASGGNVALFAEAD